MSEPKEWTNFEIATVVIAIIGLTSLYFSYDTKKKQETSSCESSLNPNLQKLKSNFITLPKDVSGCEISPSEYCGDARKTLIESINLTYEINRLTGHENKVLSDLELYLAKVRNEIQNLSDPNRLALIPMAGELNNTRHILNQILVSDLKCI